MAIFVFLILMGLMFPGLLSESNDLKKSNLKGKVRSIMEIKYSVKHTDDTILKDSVVSHYFTIYNEKGYKTEITKFEDKEGFTLSRYIFNLEGIPVGMNRYDKFGNLILVVDYVYDQKGYKNTAYLNWPSEDPVVMQEVSNEFGFNVDGGNLIYRIIYIRQHGGMVGEEVYLGQDSNVLFRNIFRHDFKGMREELDYFNSRGNMSWRTMYNYDRDGKILDANIYKDNRVALELSYQYKCDSMGNWVSRIEDRNLHWNVLTAHLDSNDYIVDRMIEYYQSNDLN